MANTAHTYYMFIAVIDIADEFMKLKTAHSLVETV